MFNVLVFKCLFILNKTPLLCLSLVLLFYVLLWYVEFWFRWLHWFLFIFPMFSLFLKKFGCLSRSQLLLQLQQFLKGFLLLLQREYFLLFWFTFTMLQKTLWHGSVICPMWIWELPQDQINFWRDVRTQFQ